MSQGEAFWFLDTLVIAHLAHEAGQDGISVLESRAARGDSPPLHVHDEDEVFHVLSGEVVVQVNGVERLLRAGDTALGPKGLPHTYRVKSDEARWLVITRGGHFEQFVRELSRPALRAELPPAGPPPTDESVRQLTEVAARYGVAIVGPPLADT